LRLADEDLMSVVSLKLDGPVRAAPAMTTTWPLEQLGH
jgi:hypothetical protein